MTIKERALGALAIAAICVALFAWRKWSDTEAVAGFYRSEYFKTCLQSAANDGVTVELALYRCQGDKASVKIARSIR
jgi:hypothetical protein